MKIGFLITARLKSTRLPLKLLLDLNGKTVIERVIERCKQVTDISEIILCTSTNPQDKPLVDIAKSNNIYYYLGNEMDVLKRLSDAANFFDLDYIINITGENPLFSIYHANLVVDQAKTENNDFIYIEGLPIGCAVYGLRLEALKTVCEIKQEIDTEIWGPLINRPEIFNVYSIKVEDKLKRDNLRLTTDYIEDYQLIQALFSKFPIKKIPTYYEIIKIIDNESELLDLNKKRKQLSLDPEISKRIDVYYSKNLEKIYDIKNKIYNTK